MKNTDPNITIPTKTFNEVVEMITQSRKDEVSRQARGNVQPRLYIGYLKKDDLLEFLEGRVPVGEVPMAIAFTGFFAGTSPKERIEIMKTEGKAFAQAKIGIPVLVVMSSEVYKEKQYENEPLEEAIVVVGMTHDNRVSSAILHTDRLYDNTLIVTDAEYEPCMGEDEKVFDQYSLAPFFDGFFDEMTNDPSSTEIQSSISEFVEHLVNYFSPMNAENQEVPIGENKSIDDIFD